MTIPPPSPIPSPEPSEDDEDVPVSDVGTSRRWCFQIFNPDGLLDESDMVKWGANFLVYQEEVGHKKGGLHLQGYIEMRKPVRFSHFKIKGYFYKARGTPAQCETYCTKEDTRVGGPYKFGVRSGGQGARNDVLALRDAVISGKSDTEILRDDALAITAMRMPRGLALVRSALDEPLPRKGVKCTLHYGPPGMHMGGGAKKLDVVTATDKMMATVKRRNHIGYKPPIRSSVTCHDVTGEISNHPVTWFFFQELAKLIVPIDQGPTTSTGTTASGSDTRDKRSLSSTNSEVIHCPHYNSNESWTNIPWWSTSRVAQVFSRLQSMCFIPSAHSRSLTHLYIDSTSARTFYRTDGGKKAPATTEVQSCAESKLCTITTPTSTWSSLKAPRGRGVRKAIGNTP